MITTTSAGIFMTIKLSGHDERVVTSVSDMKVTPQDVHFNF
jgi:hypothetical protein